MIGSLLMGGAGIWNMMQGNKGISNLASNQPSQQDLEKPFQRQQGLIDRMTNFGQYSGQAMDLASQQGNKGVEDAMMMGMGGSQANAIRNRLKRSSMAGVYDKFNQGLGSAAQLQGGIDQTISGQLEGNRQYSQDIKMSQYNNQMAMGQQLMPEGGLRGLLGMGMSTIGLGGPNKR